MRRILATLTVATTLCATAANAERSERDVTVLDCTKLALEANSDLRIRRIAVLQAGVAISEQHGAFFPRLHANVALRRERQATPITFFSPAGTYGVTTLRYGAGVLGLLPFGTTYQLRLASEVSWTAMNAASLSPQHINTLELKLAQPLLRGAWTETRARLEAARVDEKATREQVELEIQGLLLRVVQAYWNLVARRKDVETARRLLELAEAQLDATTLRVRAGNLSRLDLIEAKAAIAARRQELLLAEEAVLPAEHALLSLLYRRQSDGKESLDLALSLRPVDEPRLEAESRPLGALVRTALERHPAMRAQATRLRSQAIVRDAAESAALPRLDLEASVGGSSIAGASTFGDAGHSNAEAPNQSLVGGHGTAWKQVFTFDQPFVQVGLNFELPFSNEARRAEATRQRLTLRRLRVEREGLAAKIAVDVRDAWLRVRKAASRARAAEEGLDLARQNLEAAQKKFKGGITTSYDVLRVQQELARARRSLVAAQQGQVIARAELEGAMGTMPSYLGIDVR